MVLSNDAESCAICNLNHPKLLIASHIIPLSKNERERLNPHNGLCLCSIHDKSFDSGLISINENFKLLVSKELRKIDKKSFKSFFANYENEELNIPKKFYPSLDFLEYHHENIFLGA